MTIEEAIVRYLNARRAQGLRWVETLGRTLRVMFESVLTEHIAILTTDQVNELRARLGRRDGRQSAPLQGRARDLHWRMSRTFLAWCVHQGFLTKDPLAPRKPQHIGELVRRLREEAWISRRDLSSQTGLLVTTLGRFETARLNLNREQLLRLLQHPSMTRLPDKAKEAGLDLGLDNNGVGKA